jgi:glycosyltransferase involved in cell wall biosynthesis
VDIIQINSQLSKGGGPQTYMQMATKMLREHGNQVSIFGMQDEANRNQPDAVYFVQPMELLKTAHSASIRERVGGASRALWSSEASRKIQALLSSRHFDLAHIHNFRYELSPSILSALKRRGLPIVQTLHDYSLLCPRGCFYSERIGVCEKCRIYRYYQAPLTRCIKGSLSRSFFAAVDLAIHRFLGIIERNVDLFIAPSRFLQKIYIEYGIPENKIYFLPNAFEMRPYLQQEASRYCVFVGALRRLKGVYTILAVAKKLPSISFVIIGDGEEYDNLKAEIASLELFNVSLAGHLTGKVLRDVMARAQMLLIPSEWYENCPMVILEAYALKKPVIGARIGGIPELVEDNVTGILFEPTNVEDLVEKIVYLDSRPELGLRMGEEGRKRLEQNYNTPRHYGGLMNAYRIAQEKIGL